MLRKNINKLNYRKEDYILDSLIFEINSFIPSKITNDELRFTIDLNQEIARQASEKIGSTKSKADYAFLLHDLYHLKSDGIMTISRVCTTMSIWT